MSSPSDARDQARTAATDLFQLIVQTSALLRDARDSDKILRAWLRGLHAFLGADAVCVAARDRADGRVTVRAGIPADATWDEAMLGALLADRDARAPLGVLSARIVRLQRDWGVLVVRRDGGTFATQQRHELARVAGEISVMLQRLDRERLFEVRERLDTKILRDLDPKDLYYQVLDGLHTLTWYDHSASLHVLTEAPRRLELVAEQIAWRKLKSPRIGSSLVIPDDVDGLLSDGAIHGFDFLDGEWSEWTSSGATPLARLLDPVPHGLADPDAPPVGAMLCAVLGTPADGLAVLQLGARRAGWFGAHELEIVRRFLPAMSVALGRARATEGIRRKVVDVERRAMFAHLARGVAHDVNNALGAVLPLVQQIRADLDENRIVPGTLREDLDQIERSVEVCQRIFSGMLRSAKSTSTHQGTCDVRRAIRNACDVLRGPMERGSVRLELELPEALPDIRGALAEMEQVILNLATNALEAMPRGGRLRIAVMPSGPDIRVVVSDTGRGIPAELLAEVEKPFVTTKESGTGLGLPTCRSILSGVGGDLLLESVAGSGTTITLRLGVAGADGA